MECKRGINMMYNYFGAGMTLMWLYWFLLVLIVSIIFSVIFWWMYNLIKKQKEIR